MSTGEWLLALSIVLFVLYCFGRGLYAGVRSSRDGLRNVFLAELDLKVRRRYDLLRMFAEKTQDHVSGSEAAASAVMRACDEASAIEEQVAGPSGRDPATLRRLSNAKPFDPAAMQRLVEAEANLDEAVRALCSLIEEGSTPSVAQTLAEVTEELAYVDRRIAKGQDRYNEAVDEYNRTLRSRLGRLIVSMGGYYPSGVRYTRPNSSDKSSA